MSYVDYEESKGFIVSDPFTWSIFINTHVIINLIYQSNIPYNVAVTDVGHFDWTT